MAVAAVDVAVAVAVAVVFVIVVFVGVDSARGLATSVVLKVVAGNSSSRTISELVAVSSGMDDVAVAGVVVVAEAASLATVDALKIAVLAAAVVMGAAVTKVSSVKGIAE
jgi:hypothetical protein